MILDLKHLFATENSELVLDQTFDFSDLEFGGTCPVKKPVKVNGVIQNRAGVVSLDAQMEYDYSAPCDRCAVPSSNTIITQIRHILVDQISTDETDDMLLVSDLQLDLDELIRTDLVLSLPRKHLCEPDCKGLCSVCGKNLNEGSCECDKQNIDPRLEKLKSLLADD